MILQLRLKGCVWAWLVRAIHILIKKYISISKRNEGKKGKKKRNSKKNQSVACNDDDTYIIEFKSTEKKVRFDDDICKFHFINDYNLEERALRKGPWEEIARDSERFRRRIKEMESQLGSVLITENRQRIYYPN